MGLVEVLRGEEPGIIKRVINYENKGQFGEYLTDYALSNDNIDGMFVLLKNVYVPRQNTSAEIDLLMIHEKGIFVFESKNYGGWIFGNREQLNWTQCFQGGKKYQFYNPIRQNNTHIKALAEYLNKPASAFVSYIIFSERCELKNVPQNTEDVVIVRRPEMLKDLRCRLKNLPVIYSFAEIEAMASSLRRLARISDAEKAQHVDDIKTKCPFCGSDLILREGKYGPFWGCSTYPKCRFTRKAT